jgi:hypothetical protein
MECKGFTCRGAACKNKGVYGGSYCIHHLAQNVPIKYYIQPDKSFPYSGEIARRVYQASDYRSLKYGINKLVWLSKQPNSTTYERRIYLFAIFELIKKNISLCYENERTSKWSLKLADSCLSQNPLFAAYLEDFKMKCIKSYYEHVKHQAKKKLVTFYMNHCEGLCFDVVEHMMKFY